MLVQNNPTAKRKLILIMVSILPVTVFYLFFKFEVHNIVRTGLEICVAFLLPIALFPINVYILFNVISTRHAQQMQKTSLSRLLDMRPCQVVISPSKIKLL